MLRTQPNTIKKLSWIHRYVLMPRPPRYKPFCTAAQMPHALRLALGSVDVGVLREALGRVAEVVVAHAY